MVTERGSLTVHAGGWSLILGAVAFMAVFGYLAARFDYPAILDGPAETVLPHLLATGSTGRAVWALYAFLPLIWIPAGVGAYLALRRSHPGSSLLALQCAVVAALAMMLGLMRWPTIHWRLAQLYATADSSQRAVLDALFDGLNTYLGELPRGVSRRAGLQRVLPADGLGPAADAPRGGPGARGGAGRAGGHVPQRDGGCRPVAAVNNYLLPAWMIVFGVVLARWREPMESEA